MSEAISPDVVDIEGLLEGLMNAVRDGDARALRALMGEDVTAVFSGSAGSVRGVDAVMQTWERHLAMWDDVKIARRETYVRIHGDTAWASFVWDGSGSANGIRYRVSDERWTVVMVWEDGWRIAQTHSSLAWRDWDAFRVEEDA